MATLYVDSLAVGMPFLLLRVPILVVAVARYGWIMLCVQAKNLLSHTVHIIALETITVGMVKMLALSV